jgi:hypothetical protein
MTAGEFLDTTPVEINWKIEAWNERKWLRDADIYDLAWMTALAANNPKKFPKTLQAFRPSRIAKEIDDSDRQAMKEEGAKIGMRVPV